MNDKDLLEYARFVATKFQSSRDGWVYSRDLGDLERIVYKTDHTGYNHWTKRLRRGLNWKRLAGKDIFSSGKQSLRRRLLYAKARFSATVFRDKNLPDGQINGILTHWEEDGEYLAYFQPRVGVKVLDFLEAEPEHPAAKAILAEMRACALLSFPPEDEETQLEDEADEDSEID